MFRRIVVIGLALAFCLVGMAAAPSIKGKVTTAYYLGVLVNDTPFELVRHELTSAGASMVDRQGDLVLIVVDDKTNVKKISKCLPLFKSIYSRRHFSRAEALLRKIHKNNRILDKFAAAPALTKENISSGMVEDDPRMPSGKPASMRKTETATNQRDNARILRQTRMAKDGSLIGKSFENQSVPPDSSPKSAVVGASREKERRDLAQKLLLSPAKRDFAGNIDQINRLIAQKAELCSAPPLAVTEDSYEPNNSFAQAWTITSGTYDNLGCNDEDWFKVNAAEGKYLIVTVASSETSADIDLVVYNSSQEALAGSYSGSCNEKVVVGPLSAGEYYIEVFPLYGSALYSLSAEVKDASELALIGGRVTDGSNAGIEGLLVRFYNSEYTRVASVYTDSNGDYTAPLSSAENLKIYFYGRSAGNYVSEWYDDKTDFDSADPVQATIGSTATANAQLAAGGTVAGRVADSSAVGIPDVEVAIYDLNYNYVTNGWTDGNGDYSEVGISEGNYKVFFDPRYANRYDGGNFIPEWYNDRSDFDSADQVGITAGGTTTLNAQLATGGIIAGRVTDSSAAGIPDVEVDIYDLNYNYVTYGWTDGNGDYSNSGLPTGNYKVYFYGPSAGNYVSEWYNDKSDFSSADQVGVTAGSTTTANAQLDQGGIIAGQVTDGAASSSAKSAASAGIPDVEVDIYDLNGESVANGWTDGNGYYTTQGVPAGNYKVQFWPYSGNYVSEWYNDKSDYDSADQVGVSAGATTTVNAQLAQGGIIVGRVTNDADAGIENVRVRIYDLDGNSVKSQWTDSNGDFLIQGLVAGNFKIYFNAYSAGNYRSEWYNDKSDFDSADQVGVMTGATTTVNAQLASGGMIGGQVTRSDAVGAGEKAAGTGIENVYVEVDDLNYNYVGYDYTDSSGNYAVQGLAAGDYKVYFYGSSAGNYVSEWYNDKSDFDSADPVGVTAGATTTVNAQLAQGGSIAGQVTDGASSLSGKSASSAGIADVEVDVYDLNGNYITYGWTDSNGNYAAQGIPAGNYKVEFWPTSGNYLPEWYNDKSSFNSADQVGVTVGATTTVNAQLAEGGQIGGKVTDVTGTGINDVYVRIYNLAGSRVLTAYSDNNGDYITRALSPGDYKVYFYAYWAGDYISEWYNDKGDYDTANLVSVVSGLTTAPIDATLLRPGDAMLSVSTPNGGESWHAGSTHTIDWTTAGTVGNVKLEYSTNGGTNWTTIIASTPSIIGEARKDGDKSITPLTNSYAWTLPAVASTNCLVRVSEVSPGTLSDTSDAAFTIVKDKPIIGLSKSSFNFAAVQKGKTTPADTVLISNLGVGTLNWTAVSSQPWLVGTPKIGAAGKTMKIKVVNAGKLAAGTYTGTITITDPNASNSPATINVTLVVKAAGTDAVPFGSFDTPANGATVNTATTPVSGWALDDVGMKWAKVYLKLSATKKKLIGTAKFVVGARPDIETAYPTYPQNNRAGWTFTLKMSKLPNKGVGTFVLMAYVQDLAGHQVLLGTHTITGVAPSGGAVATLGDFAVLEDGATVTGSLTVADFTPSADIYPDGLTTWVDGLPIGSLTLDTTKFTDGWHLLSWSAADLSGAAGEIGTRYFRVQNGTGGAVLSEAGETNDALAVEDSASPVIGNAQLAIRPVSEIASVPEDGLTPVFARRGFMADQGAEMIYPDSDGSIRIRIPRASRLAVYLNQEHAFESEAEQASRTERILVERKAEKIVGSGFEAYALVGQELRPLPIGASFDARDGILFWQPGPGFLGEHQIVLIDKAAGTRKMVRITIY